MKFGKKHRLIDEEALNWARNRPCEVCGRPPPSDPAHIQTVKSGGPDSRDNLLALCRTCHATQHQMGIKSFIAKHNLPVSDEKYGWLRRYDLE